MRTESFGVSRWIAILAALSAQVATSVVAVSAAEEGSKDGAATGSIKVAGSDVVRIVPPVAEPPTPVINPEPSPDPTPEPASPLTPLPGPGVNPTPPAAPKPDGVAGRRLPLQVRLGSLPADPNKGAIAAKLDGLDQPLAEAVGLMSARGALVVEVAGGGPAAQSGMRVGDIVVSLNGAPIASGNELRQRLSQLTPGTFATVEVWRFFAEERDLLVTLRKLADEGNAAVMFRLGYMTANGNGVPRDDAEAVRWFRKGADGGNATATTWLAFMTLEGRGTDKNPQEAVRLYRIGADAGNPDAMRRLGKFLIEGKVISKDPAQAVRLFTKAAEAGNTPSMVDLGQMYSNATGVPQNYAEAARWYQRAADLGNVAAMTNLGILYRYGRGVSQNEKVAVELYRRSADLGSASGMHNLAIMLDEARGVSQKDPERAAELIMRSLSSGHEFSYKQMTENSKTWSLDFRRSLQRRLKSEGLYNGPIDGVFGQPTTAAITALYNRNKR